MPTATETRPMRDYPCPHCGGEGQIAEDYLDAWTPITRPCGYCDGRGYHERPVLPRGAMRAFAVLWDVQGWWDDPDAVAIVHATSAAKAKMQTVRQIREAFSETPRDILAHLHVRRAPEHDLEGGN